jgi:L-cysteine:1D-myo-inositol 2-amino-2-deoxy-alpha-D-glucopyranoside ligase
MQSWSIDPVPALDGQAPQLSLWDTSAAAFVEPDVQDGASLYVCGITPYDATHMGHAATYVAFDLLVRQWLDAKVGVTYVQNVTDVDDPLLERATSTGVDWRDLAAEQIELFREDMAALNVVPPAHYVGAVESVPWIVDGVEHLVAEGLAYRVPGRTSDDGSSVEPDGDVYFDINAAQQVPPATDEGAWVLGAVSGYDRDTMLAYSTERGGDPDRPGKRDPLDPLLWRVAREGEPSWDGRTLGAGRPGWHIECSLIARRLLPAPFTVQAGGSDLRFPHHEMSAAHAYGADGVPLAHHYAHGAMVGLDGEKMSKSRGNLVFISRLRRDGVDPMAIRLALLSQTYREDWFWTNTVLTQAQERLNRWRAALDAAWTLKAARDVVESLRERLADDLDAPGALGVVDDAVARVGESRSDVSAEAQEAVALVKTALDALLGVKL